MAEELVSDVEKIEIHRLAKQGVSIEDIGDTMGMPKRRIKKILADPVPLMSVESVLLHKERGQYWES